MFKRQLKTHKRGYYYFCHQLPIKRSTLFDPHKTKKYSKKNVILPFLLQVLTVAVRILASK